MTTRFTERQIVNALLDYKAGKKVEDFFSELGINKETCITGRRCTEGMISRLTKPDTRADVELKEALNRQKSFVMISGAGSGKTTSLVKALDYTSASPGPEFRKWGQKAACFTYTEIAAKEIWNDIGNTPLSHVSTIHSLLWTLISPYQRDIRNCVLNRITQEIAELQAEASVFTALVQARTWAKI